ncbi:spore protease YyaC [Caldinitratiruptor microaerophilus]|uniref:Spore protease YyaC n=1 Tax=Caldinitratiruptor microaerophilus TaxID=671077 RepID=A0AA35CNS8_9FIRM|nr:spore protease YyaC [Caldinitratiruptor microaerophilus]BDG61858.1 spore protease YyaC [Caldinitratiruptor microaerophilus]
MARVERRPDGGPGEVRVHVDDPKAAATIATALRHYGPEAVHGADALLLLCIGTDRSIGDALGPLVGTFLEESGPHPFRVLGTLDRPVHAGNLAETVSEIGRTYRRPAVVAVDACLGRAESVGHITVAPGPLRPGAGVNKELPGVGDVHITGIVNVGGFMEYFVLQNTRLSLVMRMARRVADGVLVGMRSLSRYLAAGTRALPAPGATPSSLTSKSRDG